MEITREDVDKLKQLDRIEYRQKAIHLDSEEWYIVIVCSIFATSGFLSILIGLISLDLDLLFPTMVSVFFSGLMVIALILIKIAFSIENKKEFQALNNQYFKTEVKK